MDVGHEPCLDFLYWLRVLHPVVIKLLLVCDEIQLFDLLRNAIAALMLSMGMIYQRKAISCFVDESL